MFCGSSAVARPYTSRAEEFEDFGAAGGPGFLGDAGAVGGDERIGERVVDDVGFFEIEAGALRGIRDDGGVGGPGFGCVGGCRGEQCGDENNGERRKVGCLRFIVALRCGLRG